MSDFTGETKDGTQGNIEELMRLFPQVVTETKDGNGRLVRSVDFAALRELLGDDATENDERYDFTWAGKKEAMREAARPTRKTLRPCKEESKNWDTTRNLYIEGDNLEALKILENTYHGQVKMIYIDPPYNTGKDFIYHDDAARSEHEEKIAAGEIDKETDERFTINPETNGRYHSDWCSMMYPRLVMAKKLLRDDGVMFMSIDDNEVVNARKLCEDVFGSNNFVSSFVWEKGKEGGNDSAIMRSHFEYIICFCKNCDASGIINLDRKDTSRHIKELPERNLVKGVEGVENDGELFQLINLSKQKDYTVKIPLVSGQVIEWPSYAPQKSIDAWIKIGKVFVGKKGVPYVKSFLKDEMQGQKPSNIITQEYGTTKAGSIEMREFFGSREVFPYPKPSRLIKRLAEIGSVANSITLDFFSGTATTAHAVMQLNAEDGGNRRFIMVQLPEVCEEDSEAAKAGYKNICEIGKERIRRAGEKILAEWMEKRKSKENELALDGDGAARVRALQPDIGFRVFKVSDSNMEDVFYSPTDVTQAMLPGMVNNVKEGRNGLDLLISTRLEWGLSIDCPIDEETVDGKTVFSVDGGQMLACFETGITDAFVKKLAMRKPQFAIFRDVDFKDSAAKINAREIFKAVCGKDAPTEVRFL